MSQIFYFEACGAAEKQSPDRMKNGSAAHCGNNDPNDAKYSSKINKLLQESQAAAFEWSPTVMSIFT